MKKFISVFLCTVFFTVNVIFTPYVTTVYAVGAVDVVKSISLDNVVKMVKSLYKVGYNVATTGSGDGAASSKALDSIWGEDSAINKWLQTKLFPFMDANGNIDLTNPDTPITYDKDKQLVEFNPTFSNDLNQQLQDSIHALDGYYLIEPQFTKDQMPEVLRGYNTMSDADRQRFQNIVSKYDTIVFDSPVADMSKARTYYVTLLSASDTLYIYTGSSLSWKSDVSSNPDDPDIYRGGSYVLYRANSLPVTFTQDSPAQYVALGSYSLYIDNNKQRCMFGSPFKIFYTYKDLQNYLNKGRTYVPKLPSGGFKVNIKYINNTTNLPDITYNITTENKTETEIQNQFDTTFNNYLNDLNDFTDGGGGTINPTPTPSGGGSGGDFGDGTTPTPKPDFTDGSLTDTNTLLQKILDKLTEFSANHDKLAKTITDYIEKNDGKLDQIIEAINALSDGKTEDEKNGCKYDFTALSDFMTKLWNESDKKFDKMVELLEENNKYQKKLVNSLNEIKAILVTQTIMDVFQDRSQQTAEKAKDKFPTSLPWDIALVVNAMSAEPEKPQFNLPIQIKSLNINEEIHVDLASGEWEKLAKTCRYLLSILFILLMIQLSRKLFSNGGDD